jgi:hypothetical protein
MSINTKIAYSYFVTNNNCFIGKIAYCMYDEKRSYSFIQSGKPQNDIEEDKHAKEFYDTKLRNNELNDFKNKADSEINGYLESLIKNDYSLLKILYIKYIKTTPISIIFILAVILIIISWGGFNDDFRKFVMDYFVHFIQTYIFKK